MLYLIAIVAFLGSLLTLFSGFGLGTLLTPVFGLFFPIHVAIALTGIVHLLNNLFKLALLGKNAEKKTVLQFGIPSVIGGFVGAWLLTRLTHIEPIMVWQWGSRVCSITPLKVVIAILMLFFTFMELIPALKNLQFARRYLTLGGLTSGFFGGLSGNQGALRSAFLINAGLDKNAYIATGVVIACMVDLTRLPLYFARFEAAALGAEWKVLLLATFCAFAGAWTGNRYLKKMTFTGIQYITATLMIVFAVLLGIGII